MAQTGSGQKGAEGGRFRWQVEHKGNRVERGSSLRFLVGTVAEGIGAHALLADAPQIDVGQDER
jgi:hypothetical protein